MRQINACSPGAPYARCYKESNAEGLLYMRTLSPEAAGISGMDKQLPPTEYVQLLIPAWDTCFWRQKSSFIHIYRMTTDQFASTISTKPSIAIATLTPVAKLIIKSRPARSKLLPFEMLFWPIPLIVTHSTSPWTGIYQCILIYYITCLSVIITWLCGFGGKLHQFYHSSGLN